MQCARALTHTHTHTQSSDSVRTRTDSAIDPRRCTASRAQLAQPSRLNLAAHPRLSAKLCTCSRARLAARPARQLLGCGQTGVRPQPNCKSVGSIRLPPLNCKSSAAGAAEQDGPSLTRASASRLGPSGQTNNHTSKGPRESKNRGGRQCVTASASRLGPSGRADSSSAADKRVFDQYTRLTSSTRTPV